MSFPVATSNGQTALVNGITYVWNTSIGTWTRQQAYSGQLIVSSTQWYSQTDDVIYEWTTNNGSNFFWLDMSSSAVISNVTLINSFANSLNSNVITANTLVIGTQNANTYIQSTMQQNSFNPFFLSGM